jgi:protein-S-isoprenylcysteine O-methyltransferase Ste14
MLSDETLGEIMLFRLLMWIVMLFGGAAGGFYLDSLLFKGIHENLILHIVSFIIGLLLALMVVRVSKNTGRTLARYGRKGELKRMETNVLVKQGIYKYMRHPMHLGLFFFPLSIAFLVGSPSFILIIVPLEIGLMLILIKLFEEPEAIEKFGDEYLEYKKQVPGFCLKIHCLKALFKKVN